jgi:hypothetical protein
MRNVWLHSAPDDQWRCLATVTLVLEVVNQLRGISALLEAEFDAAQEMALLSVAD